LICYFHTTLSKRIIFGVFDEISSYLALAYMELVYRLEIGYQLRVIIRIKY